MEKKTDPSRGRIPKWAIQRVEEEVGKYGFYLAFHYFMYDYGGLYYEIQLWRAFDRYARIHNIKEIPLEVED